jgi:hypothetical protein
MTGRIQKPKSRILVNSGSDRKYYAHEVATALERVDLGGPERRLRIQEQHERSGDPAAPDFRRVAFIEVGTRQAFLYYQNFEGFSFERLLTA